MSDQNKSFDLQSESVDLREGETVPSLSEKHLDIAAQFMQNIPFNQLIGLVPHKVSEHQVRFKIAMDDKLIGNTFHGILHGGVIASAMDVAGGTVALLGAFARMHKIPEQLRLERLAKLGTIDMRVDYLRPGRGKEFFADAILLRVGSKVAVTRMEFINESGQLLAVGTGTYICG